MEVGEWSFCPLSHIQIPRWYLRGLFSPFLLPFPDGLLGLGCYGLYYLPEINGPMDHSPNNTSLTASIFSCPGWLHLDKAQSRGGSHLGIFSKLNM